jgi:hypothetical protein
MGDFMDGNFKEIFEFIRSGDVYSAVNEGCIEINNPESWNTVLVSAGKGPCNVTFFTLIGIFDINMEV